MRTSFFLFGSIILGVVRDLLLLLLLRLLLLLLPLLLLPPLLLFSLPVPFLLSVFVLVLLEALVAA